MTSLKKIKVNGVLYDIAGSSNGTSTGTTEETKDFYVIAVGQSIPRSYRDDVNIRITPESGVLELDYGEMGTYESPVFTAVGAGTAIVEILSTDGDDTLIESFAVSVAGKYMTQEQVQALINEAIQSKGYTATIYCNWDEGYGSWLSYSTDGGATWHEITKSGTTTLTGVTKIRFNWEPDDWAESEVYYGGEYVEDYDEWYGVTYVVRNTDITLTEDTAFRTNWAP